MGKDRVRKVFDHSYGFELRTLPITCPSAKAAECGTDLVEVSAGFHQPHTQKAGVLFGNFYWIKTQRWKFRQWLHEGKGHDSEKNCSTRNDTFL